MLFNFVPICDKNINNYSIVVFVLQQKNIEKLFLRVMVYGEKMHIAINIVKWNENKWINIAHGIQFNRVKEKHNKKSIADIFVFIFCVYTLNANRLKHNKYLQFSQSLFSATEILISF